MTTEAETRKNIIDGKLEGCGDLQDIVTQFKKRNSNKENK